MIEMIAAELMGIGVPPILALYLATKFAAGEAVDFADLTGDIAIAQMAGGVGAGPSTYWRGDGSWAALPPTAFSALTGNIAVSQMAAGAGASPSTFWRGDGSWAGLPATNFSELLGNIAVGQMASGTGASATTVWHGDGTWKSIYPVANRAAIPTRVIPFTTFMAVDRSPWKTGTSAGPGAIQDAAGTWFELDLAAGFNIVEAEWFGAGPAVSAATNTLAIQAAINALNALGGGIVRLGPGIYQVSATSETGTWFYSPALPTQPLSPTYCLILKSGVHLEGVGLGITTLKIGVANQSQSVVGVFDTLGGSVSEMTVDGNWDLTTPGAISNCILLGTAAIQGRNINFSVHDAELKNCGAYPIGFEWGDALNNEFYNLYIHDVGDDGIDYKVRYGFATTDGTPNTGTSIGSRFDNILIERFGLQAGLNPAGLDIRGPALISNIYVRDFGSASYSSLPGIRVAGRVSNAGTLDNREGADGTTITNIRIEGNPAFDCMGIQNANANGIHVSNGHIKGCRDGVSHGGFASVATLGDGGTYSNILVEGSRAGTAFDILSGSHNQFIGCTTKGEIVLFSSKAGNLVAGQLTFTPDNGFDAATVKVYKNSVLLTGGGVDYTLTGAVSVVLTVAVLITDEIKVVTPNAVGFALSSAGNSLIGCNDIETTTFMTEAGAAVGSTSVLGTRSDDQVNFVSITSDITNNTTVFNSTGPGATVGARHFTKGLGPHEFFVGSRRGLKIGGSSAAAVNWLEVVSSDTGNPLTIQAAGSDANISINLTAKGTGVQSIPQLKLGPATTVAGLPAASGALQDVVRIVTDAAAPAYGAAAVGGGAVRIPVRCDGAAWICM